MKISVFYIFVGLFIGMFIVYVTSTPTEISYKYPTLDNISNTIFVDTNNVCYKYYAKEINCDNK